MASSPESDEYKYLFDSDGYDEHKMNEKEVSSDLSVPANNNYLYDSDGYYDDGVREMNEEEVNRYYKAIQESEGFDVPSFPGTYAFAIISPLPLINLISEEVRECAGQAIKHYNNENGASFEFVKMLKANSQAALGELFFLTFQVKQTGAPPDSPTTTLQARVLAGISPDDFDVQLCRPEPTN
ncbi:uncharacterized protein LOC111008920 isoform X1 [Momordica charantia]|uniref:Uncharacterized protein LOC111008920 isoform X1 n=1 Tax=Momordica charantia TaxID=3673 RepID=A0A6J1CAH1_MOMCH|nr:uncharacterized protein LOC111008920 isoform X1 [Momordica charantia]